MATDLKLVTRIQGARDQVRDQMRSHDMPVKLTLHPDWVSRFESLCDDSLVVPTSTHSEGIRFYGLEVERGTDEEAAIILFADGTRISVNLGAP